MYKLNILPVSLFEKQISKNNMLFSHEPCDVCSTQGIKFEAVSYKDKFDYTVFKYSNYTIKRYNGLEPLDKQWLDSKNCYMIYYVCSNECATMLQFQLGE